MIAQHIAPKLSAMDLMVAEAVPPGGNWKDVPHSVPSQRLETIRQSYARGEGSRSTYYGRLEPSRPSYTMNTYFTRPGNGCHLHYDFSQLRTISYREAARLQSFPDSFHFHGSKTAIANQIGNAVPPILAYQLAQYFGTPGDVVDLFSGCGGLAQGFAWAGWRSILGTDIDRYALDTFAANITSDVVLGDIRDQAIREQISSLARAKRNPSRPLVVVGGPPCQGFSTAGKARSREDERNHLFKDYCALVDALDPDAFLFENVTGIRTMEKGAVFREILEALGTVANEVRWWEVAADQYGVPQRRKRVIIVGFRRLSPFQIPAPPLDQSLSDIAPVSVFEALSDLPPIKAGEDGSALDYASAPITNYQKLMRGQLPVPDYVAKLSERAGLTQSMDTQTTDPQSAAKKGFDLTEDLLRVALRA